MLSFLDPRLWGAVVLAVVLSFAGGYFKGSHSAHKEDEAKALAERVALNSQAQAQRDKNLDLQRASEKRYTVQAETREKVITRIITEVRDATTSLASCPVPEPAIRLLNDAASCASTDSPASCGAGDAMR